MSTDAWEEIQAVKCKRNSLRERLENRKRQRQEILGSTVLSLAKKKKGDEKNRTLGIPTKLDHRVEPILLKILCDISLTLPITSIELLNLISSTSTNNRFEIRHEDVCGWLQKFSDQKLIRLNESNKTKDLLCLEIIFADSANLMKLSKDAGSSSIESNRSTKSITTQDVTIKNQTSTIDTQDKTSKNVTNLSENVADSNAKQTDELMALLAMPSTKEKATKKIGEEILYLLNRPTAKERSLMERFRSQDGGKVTKFCDDGTRKDCRKNRSNCTKLHFEKIIQKHTDESLGDCSFLNTCFHMDTCKYVHYEVEQMGSTGSSAKSTRMTESILSKDIAIVPQWIQCDLRFFDMSVLGKFAVIMADPPWDIHMELPYGTMSDDEMKQLNIPALQDEGLLFLWVTGRAMELGRDCLKLWGYDRVDELIWVKTNQLQRIIRTGRTGHWLNHGKEHCLVGMKGNPKGLNRGIDCDVIVSEVRATSHKPDEIYGIIERLSPGSKKLELFGRMHNIQPNWLTLGNQVDGVKIVDSVLIDAFKKRYPNGNCMINDKKLALMI